MAELRFIFVFYKGKRQYWSQERVLKLPLIPVVPDVVVNNEVELMLAEDSLDALTFELLIRHLRKWRDGDLSLENGR